MRSHPSDSSSRCTRVPFGSVVTTGLVLPGPWRTFSESAVMVTVSCTGCAGAAGSAGAAYFALIQPEVPLSV